MYSPADGTVVNVDETSETLSHIAIDIGNGLTLGLVHVKPGTVRVAKGEEVKVGMELAEIGTAVHLHLHIFNQDGVSHPFQFRFYRLASGVFITDQVPEQGDTFYFSSSEAPVSAVLEEYISAPPQTFALAQNYPNPFNSQTIIRFSLPTDTQVNLSIYNLAGQKVATLVEGNRQAGTYAVDWDGTDESGSELASGVYLYRLKAGDQIETSKLLLLQ